MARLYHSWTGRIDRDLLASWKYSGISEWSTAVKWYGLDLLMERHPSAIRVLKDCGSCVLEDQDPQLVRTSLRLTSHRQPYWRHVIGDLVRMYLLLEYCRTYIVLSKLLSPAFWVIWPWKNALSSKSLTLYAKFCHSGEAQKH